MSGYIDEETQAVIAESAASAAEELAAWQQQQRLDDFAALQAGQQESAYLQAEKALEERFGSDEWSRLAPQVAARLKRNPHLLSREAMTSPGVMARSLLDVATLVRSDLAAADQRNHWAGVMRENEKTLPVRVGRR